MMESSNPTLDTYSPTDDGSSGRGSKPFDSIASSPTEFALDWDGPDDPDNPMNWSWGKKMFHIGIPSVYSFAMTLGISTFVAAVPLIQAKYDVSRTVAILSVSLYAFGFVIGTNLSSPMSEIFGRRCVYWTSFPMLVIFDSIAVAADNITVLLVFRFLAGVGGSGILAVGAGTISDLWTAKDRGRVGLPYMIGPYLGPSLGPLIGACILDEYHNDIRWAVWVVLCVLAPVGLALPFMSETSKTRILHLRAKKRGVKVDEMTASEARRKIGQGLLRPLLMTTVELVSVSISLYSAYAYAVTYSFFGSYAYVYSTVYHFNLKQIGLCYIPVLIGFLLALVTVGYIDATKYQKEALRTNGRVPPEERLYAALVGSLLVPIGLLWYAWAPHKHVHWIVPVLAGVPFGWGMLASFVACVTYLVDVYGPENAASAIAANGTIRFTLGAVMPLFIIQVYEKLGIQWAGSLFAFISVALIPVPWIYFWKGKRIREMSRFQTSSL